MGVPFWHGSSLGRLASQKKLTPTWASGETSWSEVVASSSAPSGPGVMAGGACVLLARCGTSAGKSVAENFNFFGAGGERLAVAVDWRGGVSGTGWVSWPGGDC